MSRRARPHLSQHFLHDRATAARIADALNAPSSARVLEIGPGQGALTEHLLAHGWNVIAVELDAQLAAGLRERYSENKSLRIEIGDVLEYTLPEAPEDEPWYVIGNLPYAVTSPILFWALGQIESAPIEELVFMVQREVADRLVAKPGTKARGALTVGVRLWVDVERLFDVSPGCFKPPPKVRSSVVRLNPHGRYALDAGRRVRIRALVRGLFGHRRKQLQKSLRLLEPWRLTGQMVETVQRETEIDLHRRPETLSLEEWLALDAVLADGERERFSTGESGP